MTPLQTSEPADDEIDLRKYLDVILRWWREILLIVLIFAVLAAAGVLFLRGTSSPTYKATADVAIVRTVSDVTFDERFVTNADPAGSSPQGWSARRGALLALAESPSIAVQVIAALGDQLEPRDQEPARLAARIDAVLGVPTANRADTDLIRISARAQSPDLAAAIASAWAEAYVSTVNQVYGQVPDEMLVSIEAEQSQAEASYQTAQRQLEAVLAKNRAGALAREITAKEALIVELQRSGTDTIARLVDQGVAARERLLNVILGQQVENAGLAYVKEASGQRALLASYMDALYRGQTAVFSEQVDLKLRTLDGYYTRLGQVSTVLEDARALRSQIVAGSEQGASGGALTLQMLKLAAFAQVLGASGETIATESTTTSSTATGKSSLASTMHEAVRPEAAAPLPWLQFQLDGNQALSAEAMIEELDSLIASLEQRLPALESQITALSDEILAGEGYSYLDATADPASDLAVAARALQAQVETGRRTLTGATPAVTLPATPVTADDALAPVQLPPLPGLAALEADLVEQLAASPLAAEVTQLEDEVRGLKAQLEQESANALQLTQERDLARETLSTVSSKVTELKLARAAAGSEVRLAAGAVPPISPERGTSLLVTVAIAAAVGLVVALVIVFLANYMGRKPLFGRKTAQPAQASAGRGMQA